MIAKKLTWFSWPTHATTYTHKYNILLSYFVYVNFCLFIYSHLYAHAWYTFTYISVYRKEKEVPAYASLPWISFPVVFLTLLFSFPLNIMFWFGAFFRVAKYSYFHVSFSNLFAYSFCVNFVSSYFFLGCLRTHMIRKGWLV